MANDDFVMASRKLMLLDRAIGASLEEAAAAGAEPIREEVERRAPRGATFDLSKSVKDRPVESSANRAVHAVSVGEYYGYFHEYGTSKMSARPFFRPAILDKQQESEEAMQAVVLAASRSVTG